MTTLGAFWSRSRYDGGLFILAFVFPPCGFIGFFLVIFLIPYQHSCGAGCDTSDSSSHGALPALSHR